MSQGLEVKDRIWKLRKVRNCFVGSECVTWLSTSLKISREDATNVARQIMRTSRFHPITRDVDFEDKATLYQLTQSLILNATTDLSDSNSNLEFAEGSNGAMLKSNLSFDTFLSKSDSASIQSYLSDIGQSHSPSSQSFSIPPRVAPFSNALDFIVHLLELLLNVYRTHRLQIDMFGMMTCDMMTWDMMTWDGMGCFLTSC